MKKKLVALLSAAFVLANAAQLTARTWTEAATGRTVEADYVKSDATHVFVKTPTRSYKLAIARLSDADKAFIKEQSAKLSQAPAPAADLESRMVGYWVVDVKKTLAVSKEELHPQQQALLARIVFEFQKGKLILHGPDGSKDTQTYAVKSEDKASNTLTLGFPDGERTATLEGDQLTLNSEDGGMVLNRISKEAFEKRLKGN